MYSRAKRILLICLPALFAGMLLSACENDLKKIREISQNQLNMDVDTVRGVNIIFS